LIAAGTVRLLPNAAAQRCSRGAACEQAPLRFHRHSMSRAIPRSGRHKPLRRP